MAQVKVLGGDWRPPRALYHSFGYGALELCPPGKLNCDEKRSLSGAEIVEATEENVKRFGGAAAFGLAGAALFGPVGLLAGVIMGGNKKKHVIIVKWPDGKKVMLETPSGLYKKMLANAFA